jgi:hypothetical protein
MIKWLKDKLGGGTTGDAQEPAGGQVSEGPNSFGDLGETSTGGADSVYGTPDATPSTVLGDGDTPPTPSAS